MLFGLVPLAQVEPHKERTAFLRSTLREFRGPLRQRTSPRLDSRSRRVESALFFELCPSQRRWMCLCPSVFVEGAGILRQGMVPLPVSPVVLSEVKRAMETALRILGKEETRNCARA